MRPSQLAAVALLTFAAPAGAQHAITDASWLRGCWEQRSGQRLRVERWYEPADGAMRGTSRSFNGEVETGGERLRIFLDSGMLVYGAHPSSQAYTEFRAAHVGDTALIFENPAHDFPQRIIYRPHGTDSLLVQVEGDRDGRQPPVVFRFRRGACAPGEAPGDAVQGALASVYSDLERRLGASAGALAAWMVEHAEPGYAYRSWTTGGYLARTIPLAALERAARSGGASATPPSVVVVRIDAVHALGDTADVLVTTRQAWNGSGRSGAPARELVQRRIDRWIRAGTRWRLASSALVGEEHLAGGRSIRRDGRPVDTP